MGLIHRRIFACDTCQGEDREPDVCVDLIIDDSNDLIAGTWPLFGTWGTQHQSRNNFFPIEIRKDGTVDFGSEHEGERYSETTLRERKIRKGELFSITDSAGNEYIYKIHRLVNLSGG